MRKILGDFVEEARNEDTLRPHVVTDDVVNLPLPDHRHPLVASQRPPGCSHAAEAKPRPDQSFDPPVLLLDDIV
jgi:hypothetical protein